jgi:hypothetical protein
MNYAMSFQTYGSSHEAAHVGFLVGDISVVVTTVRSIITTNYVPTYSSLCYKFWILHLENQKKRGKHVLLL